MSFKGFTLSVEAKEKIRQARLGTHATEETRRKMSLSHMGNKSNLGLTMSPETRRKMSESHKRNHPRYWLGKTMPTATRQKMSLAHLGNKYNLGHKASEATRLKMSLAHIRNPVRHWLGKTLSEAIRAKLSAVHKGRRQSPEHVAKRMAHWQDPEWANRQVGLIMKGQHIKPNKPETIVLNMLNALYPNEWQYVGDGSFVVGRLNPDFVNVNGKKQIIEVFGDYWHGEREGRLSGQGRIDTFAKYGFSTLIIWESELKSQAEVEDKILAFCGASQSRGSRGSNTPGNCRDFTRDTLQGVKRKSTPL